MPNYGLYQSIYEDLKTTLKEEGTLKQPKKKKDDTTVGEVTETKSIDPEEPVLPEEFKEAAMELKSNPGLSSAQEAIEILRALKDDKQNEVSKLFINELKVEY